MPVLQANRIGELCIFENHLVISFNLDSLSTPKVVGENEPEPQIVCRL